MEHRSLPPRRDVVGTPVSLTSYDQVLRLLDTPLDCRATVVTVCNVHSVMTARRDPGLRQVLDGSDIATPDGVPLVWALRATANPNQKRVYGPELMRRAIAYGVDLGWKHYLLGGSPATINRLESAIQASAPGSAVVGSHSPPFRPMTFEEESAIAMHIRDSGASIVWVGLGMPKQELWMWKMRDQLPGATVLGVGAAFDFIAGTKPQAPSWMQRSGLEWFFRLVSEPRRLWRRYAWNNPAFIGLMLLQLVRGKLSHRLHGTRRTPPD